MSERPRVLLAESAGAPPDLVTPVAAALALADLDVQRIDVGKIGQHAGPVGRVIQFILGEDEGRRLDRELTAFQPEVTIAFEPGAAAALCDARDRRGMTGAPVVAIVPELAPRPAWAVDADRFAVLDDEAAVALSDLGLDGARAIVVGPIVARAFFEAGQEARAAARVAFKLPAEGTVLLVAAARLAPEVLSAVPMQLALFEKQVTVLFDAGDDADAAALLRKAVPGLGLKAKLFGKSADGARLWRAADAVIGRARAGVIFRALAAGCGFVALEPAPGAEESEARALVERGIGRIASKALLLASAYDDWAKDPSARAAAAAAAEARSADGAGAIAALVAHMASDRLSVLEETFAAAREREEAVVREREEEATAVRRATGPASTLEDLSAGESDEMAERLAAERTRTEARVRRELDEARAEMTRWERRKSLAESRGDARLAEEANRELERKRARVQAALAALKRLGVEAPIEDQLADLKDRMGTAGPPGRASTLDDELAALKRKMESDKGTKR